MSKFFVPHLGSNHLHTLTGHRSAVFDIRVWLPGKSSAVKHNVFRRIFNYNNRQSVKAVALGFGRLNLKHFIMLRKLIFTDI